MQDIILSQQKLNARIIDESDMMGFGALLAKNISKGIVIFLQGDLGAGKTTLVRGFLRQLGYNGAVKSPTFTLLEAYTINGRDLTEQAIYHFDLYRLSDPEELDYIGLSDYIDGQAIALIEWPDKGTGFLPKADLSIHIEYYARQRQIEMIANTDRGKQIFASMLLNQR